MHAQIHPQRGLVSPDNLAWLPRRILTANAIALGIVGGVQAGLDLLAYFFGRGPMAESLHQLPEAIGAFEAHGLALLLAVLLFYHRGHIGMQWHLTAAAIHLLLGTANLLFWPVFADNGLITLGVVSTFAHLFFFMLEIAAAAIRLSALPADSERP